MPQKSVDLSLILPAYNEGEAVRTFLDELIVELEKTKRSYEIFAIDTPTANPSYPVFKEYAEKNENFYAIDLSYRRPAGSDKSVKYMIGFTLAKGKYIMQMDTDGQDDPHDIPKFLEKLDAGYDLVVGHKQNRKDGKVYMLSSKISNTLTRTLTGADVHDMNCGFKGYQAGVAKSLNLKGRLYRFIPAILAARKYKITEVPINNRKREHGTTNFSFSNRLQGGLFDMATVIFLTKVGDTPNYFFGWVSLLTFIIGSGYLLASLALFALGASAFWWALFLAGGSILWNVAIMSTLLSFKLSYEQYQHRERLEDYHIREVYPRVS